MPRRLTGTVRERRLSDGCIAYDVRIRDQQVLVGYAPDVRRAEVELLLERRLLPLARRGEPWWEHVPAPTVEAPGAPSQASALTVERMLSDYHAAICARYGNQRSRNAYLSPLTAHVGPFFAYDGDRPRTVQELTGPLVTAFVQAKRAEREVLCDLADTLAELSDATRRDEDALREALDGQEWLMLMRYGQRGGGRRAADPRATGRFSISTRGLSNNEINRCLSRLRDAMRLAEEDHDLTLRDPTARRRLPAREPDRTWLMPDALEAIFDAARELDGQQPCGRGGRLPIGRYPLVVCLALAGPRVSELCAFAATDLRSDGLHVAQAKTSAGRRVIELHPVVRRALEGHRRSVGGEDVTLLATTFGAQRDRGDVRRVLATIIARARDLAAARGQDPLPERITPHTFRRTYLTYLYWAGHPINFAMHQAGHKDSRMLLEIYQGRVPRVLDERVAAWVARV
jgi:integrase